MNILYGPREDSLLVTDTYVYSDKLGDDGEKLKLDVYYDPAFADSAMKPVIINNHGGGWNSTSDRTYLSQLWMRHFAHKGFVCVSIDYREGNEYISNRTYVPRTYSLHDCFTYATRMAMEDVYDATSFVIGLCDRYGADPSKIILTGGSAGAINSLNAEYGICNGDELAVEHLPAGFNYAGVVACAGGVWKEGKDAPVWKQIPCPILFFHGDVDNAVDINVSSSSSMVDSLMRKGFIITGKVGKKIFAEEPENFFGFGPEALAPGLDACGASYRFFRFEGGDHSLSTLPYLISRDEMLRFIEENVLGGEHVAETLAGNDDGEPRNWAYLPSHKEEMFPEFFAKQE